MPVGLLTETLGRLPKDLLVAVDSRGNLSIVDTHLEYYGYIEFADNTIRLPCQT